ncbi:Multidrug resistance protein MdtK [Candidatus Annandia adelgestsuga]|uniref:Multidrug-efflux transporter n=1 Tax=Candidatus Annandia adelgestsuga TaxID=1302411 RepID=A0A3S9J815_9ENTR|nr:MATE family efflux transporter [Candidatus Annandia adelgestsuga]AZP36372.1 Multidrug resistance protein MdtK [Candidatus Annandia adelgestsuga]
MNIFLIEIRKIVTLSIPVIFAQLSQTAIGITNTIMASNAGTTDIAAIAIGSSIWIPIVLFGHGLLLPVTPIISKFYGSKKFKLIRYYISQAYWFATLISIFMILIILNSSYIINFMHHINSVLEKKSLEYLKILVFGVPAYLYFQVIKNQFEGISKTTPNMIIGFLGFLLNIPINYIFINGYYFIPKLGGIGCGLTTVLIYWIMFISLRIWMFIFYEEKKINNYKIIFPNINIIYKLIKKGFPIALSLFFEVTLFALVALFISPMGVIEVTGHQIALNFSSLIFVVPLSISTSATIRIGFHLGRGATNLAKISSLAAQFVGFLTTILVIPIIILYRYKIASFYNSNTIIINLASELMLITSVYHFSDSIQVINNGILRGYQDTKSIFIITFFSYWILGLPLGYILSLTNIIIPPLGPKGFWYGFIIGLTSSAIMMTYHIYKLQNFPVSKKYYKKK